MPVTRSPGEKLKREYCQLRIYAPWPPLDVALDPQNGWPLIYQAEALTCTNATYRPATYIELGSAQLWYYPADRLLILWELLLHDGLQLQCDHAHPSRDANWLNTHEAIERWAVSRWPDTQSIATPGWEPDVEPEEWSRALVYMGYDAVSPSAFVKQAARHLEGNDAPVIRLG